MIMFLQFISFYPQLYLSACYIINDLHFLFLKILALQFADALKNISYCTQTLLSQCTLNCKYCLFNCNGVYNHCFMFYNRHYK